jgi:cytochrome c-type biogenesis protein CcmH/NrfF
VWEVLWALVPFLILIGFWAFLMRYTKRRAAEQQDPVLEELKGIREELVRLRKALEQRGLS